MRAVFVFVLLAGFAAGAQADDFETNKQWCVDSDADPDLRIGGCTWLLQSGRLAEGGHATAYESRGIAYFDKGQYDRAIRDFDQAIALNPDDADYYYYRGNAYRKKGQHDRAIRDYGQAIALKPDLAAAYNNRGIVYSNKGQYDRAIRDYGQAIALNPDYADCYYNRGSAYGNKGQYDRAIRDYGQAIALNPDFAVYYNSKAWLLATARDPSIRNGWEAVRLA